MLTIGADPEFFLKKGKRNVSAHGLVKGTKQEPHKLIGGACQLDGTAVEFNVDPSKNAGQFEKNINKVLKQIRAMVPKEYTFDIRPSVHYSKKYFEKLPDDVKELGCNPDFNAYKKGKPNKMPKNVGTMRTGAGHIHFGFTKDADVHDINHITDCMLLVRNFDLLVRPIEHLWDTDNDRRKMYGKLGCFRPKPYGVEYRSLSNAWVARPELHAFIFYLARYAYLATIEGMDLKQVIPQENLSKDVWNKLVCQICRTVWHDQLGYVSLPALPKSFKPAKVVEKKRGTKVRKSERRVRKA
jgi:hypothetical protein